MMDELFEIVKFRWGFQDEDDMENWLVVWNMNLFFHIFGMSSSQLTFIYFSEG